MKLTEENKKLLIKWGYTENDFPQIERALNSRKCKYELSINDGLRKECSKEEAIESLGIETFLSGVSRAAFHWTSARVQENKTVFFDYCKFFED